MRQTKSTIYSVTVYVPTLKDKKLIEHIAQHLRMLKRRALGNARRARRESSNA